MSRVSSIRLRLSDVRHAVAGVVDGVGVRPAGRGLEEELEALAVPGEDGGGLHDDETGPPARPDLREADPEDSVPPRQAWSANGSLEDQELMAKREVLKRDGGGTGQEGAQEGPETDRENHPGPPA